ncbi:MAG: mechanosensitive ion channel protein, partial [Crocosphaera sp.]
MPITLVEQNWFRWAIMLILGFPLIMIFLNEIIVRLRQQERPLMATIVIFRNLVFPIVALLLFLTRVVEIPEEATV